ncbi:MAG: ribonuclease P protein component [Flavobacteriaceae bacterium]|nr:ribonuclease P protein component [Flavobacteriaceae bacterium]|tara:strand:- start:178360 stop:178755 length:396 start_codon:yes stop_codon:yes gene_type:complete
MRFTFSKNERLKSKKQIENLFSKGKLLHQFPLQIRYQSVRSEDTYPLKVAFSVPKRNFKKAVDRNRIKRLLRECYRHQKHKLYESNIEPYNLMILYIGKEEPEYQKLFNDLDTLLSKFIAKTSKINTSESE